QIPFRIMNSRKGGMGRKGAPAAGARRASQRLRPYECSPQRERAGVGPREHWRKLGGMGRNVASAMRCSILLAVALVLDAAAASAQVTPAAGYTPPDDTPSIRVGATLFANYTY